MPWLGFSGYMPWLGDLGGRLKRMASKSADVVNMASLGLGCGVWLGLGDLTSPWLYALVRFFGGYALVGGYALGYAFYCNLVMSCIV